MTKQTPPSLNYQELFNSLGIAYIVFGADDPDFTVLEENQAHAVMAMATRKNVVGKPVLEAFPDTSEEYVKHGKSRLLESLRKVIKTGKPDKMSDLHYDLEDEEGNLKTMFWEVIHFPVFQDGKVIAICQQTQDITDQVSAEQELSETQGQLERALAYTEVGTWIWDVKKDSVILDDNLVRLFGLNSDLARVEAPRKVMIGSVHPDDAPRVRKTIERLFKEKKESYESEYRTYDKNGDLHWLLARGHIEYNDKGEAVRFPGLVIDITKRKRTENNIHLLSKVTAQFSAALGYQQTLKAIADMIVPDVADWCSIEILEDGKIEQVAVAHQDPKKVEWAKQLRKKQGPIDVDAPTGSPAVIRSGKVEHVPVITDEMLVAAARNEKELKLLRDIGFHSVITAPLIIDKKPIGAITFVSTESHRHYDENDVEIAQALANRAALAVYNAYLFQDARKEIQERKKLQAELETLNSMLESKVKKRTEQLEKTNSGLQEEIKRRHRLENQRVQHYIDLNKTKDEFISLASHQLRTPATGVKQYVGMVLEGMAGDVSDMQRSLLQKAYESNERQLTIVSDLLKVAQLDAGKVKLRFKEVNLVELISDVIREQEDTYEMRKQHLKFDALTPHATVYADPDKMRMVFENLIDNASKYSDPGKTIKVIVSEAKGMTVVEVEDSGVGVAPDDIDRLFEKFNRIHNHLSNHVGGTGLGLYWAKKMVDLHGGIIEVESALGIGSTFSVHLPKRQKISVKPALIGETHEQ